MRTFFLLVVVVLLAACSVLPVTTTPTAVPTLAVAAVATATASASATATATIPPTATIPTSTTTTASQTPTSTGTATATATRTSPPTRTPTVTTVPTETPIPTNTPVPTPFPPALQPNTTVATYFFYWYDCPKVRCNAAQVPVVPPGWRAPLAEGGFETTKNPRWFDREVHGMASAGIQVALPVNWGAYPDGTFGAATLKGLVDANVRAGQPLKIGLFDDTSSEPAEWNDYVDDNTINGTAYRLSPKIPLDNKASGFFFYDRKIAPFFRLVPREQWALVHDRPLIVVYTAQCCAHLEHSGELWRAVKDAFTKEFGVTPWLVLEDTWWGEDAQHPPAGEPAVGEVADGRYAWGAALTGMQTRAVNNWTTTAVGPGFNNATAPGVGAADVHRREREDGAIFARDLAAIPANTDLLLVETWNEWWEGTSIAPAPYPSSAGPLLPDDTYIQSLLHWRFGAR